ncbi:hypothetical protein D3C80_1393880 [compost metagenome]
MAAGAADGNGDVGTVAGGEAGQPLEQIAGNVAEHVFDIRLRGQIVDYRLVEAGVLAQLGLPVRVWQAAHIEHQVCIDRHATLETERLDKERGAGLGLVEQAQLDRITQLIQIQVGGVDLQVGQVGDRPQKLTLDANRFGQGAVGIGQWVASAGFREALE